MSASSEPRDREREEMERAVLAGELELDDPRIRALPPTQRKELQRLVWLQEVLDAERLAGAPSRPSAADTEAARRFLSTAPLHSGPRAGEGTIPLQDRPPRAPRALRLLGPSLVAAGLLLLALGLRGWLRGNTPLEEGGHPEGSLGGPSTVVTPVSPLGTHAAESELRWSGHLPAGASWRVHVLRPGPQGGSDQEIAVSPRLHEPLFKPPVPLPERIRWRVDVVFEDGRVEQGTWIESALAE